MRLPLQAPRYPAWVVWLIGVPLVLTAIVLAVFFFTFFLIVIGLAGLVLAVRLWWLRRKLRASPSREIIEGEYVVMNRSRRETDSDEQ